MVPIPVLRFIHAFGKNYLNSMGLEGQPLSSRECPFCHVELVRPRREMAIQRDGHFILEMENFILQMENCE
ncbi:MAG: DUF2024 family protein [Verrucomicrobiales bacterium]